MAAGHIGAFVGSRLIPIRFSAGRWIVTLAATIATTYALDFVATGAGLLLVASQLLKDIEHGTALLLLVGSYLAWGVGLWAILQANWELLQSTGTSTNVLSKAAHDAVARLTSAARWHRLAAHAGYIATELAKEAPYYLGAAGAALFTDSISAVDAIVFLAGANVAAAVYELALARGMRFFLARFSKSGYASFETEWRPCAYLSEYYASVEPDERRTIAFFVEALRDVAPGQRVLVFGVGPTLHHVFLVSEKASEIHLADYLPENLREIERWLARDPGAHDWRPFIRYTLKCEGIDAPTEQQVDERAELSRAKITRLLAADLHRPWPLDTAGLASYDVVISPYCADSATGHRAEWRIFMQRILALVAPGGLFLTAALRHSRGYVVGGKLFPSPCIDEGDLRTALATECDQAGLAIAVATLGAAGTKGYSSILLACGHCRRSDQVDPR